MGLGAKRRLHCVHEAEEGLASGHAETEAVAGSCTAFQLYSEALGSTLKGLETGNDSIRLAFLEVGRWSPPVDAAV